MSVLPHIRGYFATGPTIRHHITALLAAGADAERLARYCIDVRNDTCDLSIAPLEISRPPRDTQRSAGAVLANAPGDELTRYISSRALVDDDTGVAIRAIIEDAAQRIAKLGIVPGVGQGEKDVTSADGAKGGEDGAAVDSSNHDAAIGLHQASEAESAASVNDEGRAA